MAKAHNLYAVLCERRVFIRGCENRHRRLPN